MRMRSSAHEHGSSASAGPRVDNAHAVGLIAHRRESESGGGRVRAGPQSPLSNTRTRSTCRWERAMGAPRRWQWQRASRAHRATPGLGLDVRPPLLLPDAARSQAAGMILSARTPDGRISAWRRNTTGARRGTTSTWDSDFPSRLSRRSSRARVHDPPSGVAPHSHCTRAAVRVCSTSRAPRPWTCMLSPLDSEMREASQRAGRVAGAIVSDSQPVAARPSNSRAAAELDVGRISRG